MAKDDTLTRSRGVSALLPNAPQLRTADALIEKYEQVEEALEHGRITPKAAEQINQTLKGIMGVERLGMQFYNMVHKFGMKAPVPRTPILRNIVGLAPEIAPTDGETVRKLLPDKK